MECSLSIPSDLRRSSERSSIRLYLGPGRIHLVSLLEGTRLCETASRLYSCVLSTVSVTLWQLETARGRRTNFSCCCQQLGASRERIPSKRLVCSMFLLLMCVVGGLLPMHAAAVIQRMTIWGMQCPYKNVTLYVYYWILTH